MTHVILTLNIFSQIAIFLFSQKIKSDIEMSTFCAEEKSKLQNVICWKILSSMPSVKQ